MIGPAGAEAGEGDAKHVCGVAGRVRRGRTDAAVRGPQPHARPPPRAQLGALSASSRALPARGWGRVGALSPEVPTAAGGTVIAVFGPARAGSRGRSARRASVRTVTRPLGPAYLAGAERPRPRARRARARARGRVCGSACGPESGRASRGRLARGAGQDFARVGRWPGREGRGRRAAARRGPRAGRSARGGGRRGRRRVRGRSRRAGARMGAPGGAPARLRGSGEALGEARTRRRARRARGRRASAVSCVRWVRVRVGVGRAARA